ncbi:MAG TPA: DNA polymerase III subunit beta [Candidatus Saccharimonadales bacterium]|nr:DNA polymerase III subunit beta [Candidatus Saccharimonadales bacterium]
MKLTILREELLRAVNSVGRLATSRATLPILQNIYLEVTKKQIRLHSTDLEQTLQIELAGNDLEVGALTVPARLLGEYLQNNPDETVTLSNDDTTLLINSKNSKARLKGLPAEEYPTLPTIKYDSEITLAAATLIEAVNKTLFAAALDETRPILTGLLFRFNEKSLTIVGTDGYRLAKYVLPIESQLSADYVIPRRTLQELVRFSNEEEITLAFSGSQVQLKTDGISLTSRIIDGSFPSYEAIIPKKTAVLVKMSAALLNQNLKLASLFSRDSAYSTRIEAGGERFKITAVSPQLGETKNEIKLEMAVSQEFSVSLNAQYLIDALAGLNGDVEFGFVDPKSPITLHSVGHENYLYLVMPLRSE